MRKHYNCGGSLDKTQERAYRCQDCGNVVRASVVERHDAFRRVAGSDGPLQEIAAVALEGEQQ